MLIVHHDGGVAHELSAFLDHHGFEPLAADDAERAFNVLEQRAVDGLVAELRSPRIDGMAVLARAREKHPEICAVVIAERSEVAMAIQAMRAGAADYQVPPLQMEKLLAVLERGLAHQALVARAAELEAQLDQRLGFERLTGRSRAIRRVMEQAQAIAATRATVLIEGEAGAGKGLLAQSIHRNSPRRGARFVAVSCGEPAEDVLEGELFGHAHGARGSLELADGGTLFLDRIGEAPPSAQVKLLRVLQDRAFERVGGGETIRVDVRVIASTDRDLAEEVRAGRFREDLLYRLGVVRIRMPALRERLEDVPLLVEGFVRELDRAHHRRVTGVTPGVLDRFLRHSWPGNVRELESTIEGMVVAAEGKRRLELSDLPPALRDLAAEAEGPSVRVGMTVSEAERALIVATLEHTGQDKPRAAAMLGIGLRTLYRKIKEYGIG